MEGRGWILKMHRLPRHFGTIPQRLGPQQRHNLSVSGASEKANYYVSLGYLEKKGWINNDEKNIVYDRYNILAKVTYQINDWLEMDTKALGGYPQNSGYPK